MSSPAENLPDNYWAQPDGEFDAPLHSVPVSDASESSNDETLPSYTLEPGSLSQPYTLLPGQVATNIDFLANTLANSARTTVQYDYEKEKPYRNRWPSL